MGSKLTKKSPVADLAELFEDECADWAKRCADLEAERDALRACLKRAEAVVDAVRNERKQLKEFHDLTSINDIEARGPKWSVYTIARLATDAVLAQFDEGRKPGQ